MKFRSLALAGMLAVIGAALGGCCCNLFCKIPDCDPCAPKCNPCDPCAPPPCAVPSAAPATAAPAATPAPTPAPTPGGAACGGSGKACGK